MSAGGCRVGRNLLGLTPPGSEQKALNGGLQEAPHFGKVDQRYHVPQCHPTPLAQSGGGVRVREQTHAP